MLILIIYKSRYQLEQIELIIKKNNNCLPIKLNRRRFKFNLKILFSFGGGIYNT